MSTSRTAFFYGTLMAPQVLHSVIYGSSTKPNATPEQLAQLKIRPAILHNYRRHRVQWAAYPGIIPTKDDDKDPASVRGMLVTGLTEGDIWRLDIFEGSDYKRVKVKVRVLEQKGGQDLLGGPGANDGDSVEGQEVEAETYEWIGPRDCLEDKEWDFEEFVKNRMSMWVREDQGFEDVSDAVAALEVEQNPWARED